MNNDQFRRLMLANSGGGGSASPGVASPKDSASGGLPGPRSRGTIPKTPRRGLSDAQADFARQLAARKNATDPKKGFRTSTPRGSKLASGYTDRAKERNVDGVDDRETRLTALEESLKKEEIDQETFDKLRFQIAGGDLTSTHLVKGLDYKLLERVRRGEHLDGPNEPKGQSPDPDEDVDAALDKLGEEEVHAIEKEKAVRKKGQLSAVSLAPGQKRTRDQILAEFKASRAAAKALQGPALGDRFRKIGTKQTPGTRIERDRKGREVLIIVDEDGHEKRKVRKLLPDEQPAPSDVLMPDPKAKPLGMEVPEHYRKQEEPEDDGDVDIFDDVGDDYDPLAGMDDSDSDEDSDSDRGGAQSREKPELDEERQPHPESGESMPPPPRPPAPRASQNYFKDARTKLLSANEDAPAMSDEAVMAAIRKASTIKQKEHEDGDSDENGDAEDREAKARRKRLLETADRDQDDIDIGFGTSRFEDEEDFGDGKMKLATWGDEDKGGQSRRGQPKRKRGPKKRKGDANNAADVLRVMEQRKKS